MVLRLGLVAALLGVWSCASDEPPKTPAEPISVATETAKIPDAPGGGDTGEAAAQTPAAPGGASAAAAPTAPAAAAAPEPAKPAEPQVEKSVPGLGQEMSVLADKLHVRQGPGTNFPVVRSLTKGERVKPIGCEKRWCKLADGEFVAQKYLARAP